MCVWLLLLLVVVVVVVWMWEGWWLLLLRLKRVRGRSNRRGKSGRWTRRPSAGII
jgi:hypothetical protein